MEVCDGGIFKTVCEKNWDDNDAQVVCTQIGLGTAGKPVLLCLCLIVCVCLSLYLFVCQSICLSSFCLPTCNLSVSLSVYLSV